MSRAREIARAFRSMKEAQFLDKARNVLRSIHPNTSCVTESSHLVFPESIFRTSTTKDTKSAKGRKDCRRIAEFVSLFVV